MGLRVWFGCALDRDFIDGGNGQYSQVCGYRRIFGR